MSSISRIKYTDILLFGVFLPVVVFASIFYEGRLPQHAFYIYLILLGLILAWTVSLALREKLLEVFQKAGGVSLSLAAFYCLGVLQLALWGIGSTHDPYATYQTLPIVFIHLCLFFLLLDTFRSPRVIRNFLFGLTVLAATLSMLGLLQDIIPNVWRKSMFFVTKLQYEFFSTFLSEDRFGFFLNLIFPAAVVLTLWEILHDYPWHEPRQAFVQFSQRSTLFKIIAVLIIGITIGWTGSRGATFAALLSLGFTLAGFAAVVWIKARERFWLLLVLVASGILAMLAVLRLSGIPIPLKQVYWWYLNIFGILQNPDLDLSYAGRLSVIQSALSAIAQHPLLGLGLGSWRSAFPQFETLNPGQLVWGHAHNAYIELMFETGLTGFVLLLVIPLILLARKVIDCLRNIHQVSNERLVLMVGILGGLVGAAVNSWSEFALSFPACMLIFIALSASIFALIRPESPAVSSPGSTPPPAAQTLAVITLIILWLGNSYLFLTSSTHSPSQLPTQTALRLSPLNPSYHCFELAQVLNKKPVNLAELEKIEKRIVKISPTARTFSTAGDIFFENQDRTKAVFYFERAFQLVPVWDDYFLKLVNSRLALAEENPALEAETIQRIKTDMGYKFSREDKIRPEVKNKLKDRFSQIKSPYLRNKLLALL